MGQAFEWVAHPLCAGGQTGSFPHSERLQSLRAKRSISHEHQKSSRLSPIPIPHHLGGGSETEVVRLALSSPLKPEPLCALVTHISGTVPDPHDQDVPILAAFVAWKVVLPFADHLTSHLQMAAGGLTNRNRETGHLYGCSKSSGLGQLTHPLLFLHIFQRLSNVIWRPTTIEGC